ncbi:multidrug and toxin extrusion protein 1-like isoform X2 [Brachyhypopomus gauderio]|uniref:multidrug and toxin extrusion protein 1-like isoform X2 n=1 Tax=Brachyhypopomus gauderio TaxID=698409 RepID=UPI004041260C
MDGSGSTAEALSTEPNTKVFCCRYLRNFLPRAYREELYHMLRMSGPLTLTITTAATGGGLALACDTLVAQTFGSKNLLYVGVILQRGILILLLFCLPCWALLINTQSLLLLLGQEPEVARIAQLYVVIYLPAVPALFLHQLQGAYLQNQGVIFPQMYTAVAANIANVLTNYIMIFWLDLGVYGSAVASSLSEIYSCVFLYGYIRWKKLHTDTWGGWTLESLQDWGPYMKLAVPSMMMLCFECWIYELGGFLAGLLGEVDLAAQHAVIMIATIVYMCPLGIQSAVCVRVGNALGAGDTAGALLTCKVSLGCTVAMTIVEGAILASVKSVIGFIFTDDRQIILLVSQILNVYCVLVISDGLVCICMGILLGSGQQKIAAIANLIGYYCIGLPVAISLMFAAKLQVAGFWLGLLICVCIQAGFFITVIFKLNWDRLTKEAVQRCRKNKLSSVARDTENDLNHRTVVSSIPMDNATSSVENRSSYQTTSLQQHEGSEPQERVKPDQKVEKHQVLLSTSQLIIRRGLTTLSVILIFAAGVAIHVLLPLPEVLDAFGVNATLHSNTTLHYSTLSPQVTPTMTL